MVYLISTATENALLFCDASKPFCEFVFWCVFLVKHTPFHLIKVSRSAPCSRPCTSPKSAFSGTSSCTRTAHTERWAPIRQQCHPTSEQKWPAPCTQGQETPQLIRGKTREGTLNGNYTFMESKK